MQQSSRRNGDYQLNRTALAGPCPALNMTLLKPDPGFVKFYAHPFRRYTELPDEPGADRIAPDTCHMFDILGLRQREAV